MSSNEALIIEAAVKHGLISELEGELALIYHNPINLHTPSYWVEHHGRQIRKNEKGIPCRLWKRSTEDDKEKYILVQSFLFTEEQTEAIIE